MHVKLSAYIISWCRFSDTEGHVHLSVSVDLTAARFWSDVPLGLNLVKGFDFSNITDCNVGGGEEEENQVSGCLIHFAERQDGGPTVQLH